MVRYNIQLEKCDVGKWVVHACYKDIQVIFPCFGVIIMYSTDAWTKMPHWLTGNQELKEETCSSIEQCIIIEGQESLLFGGRYIEA